MDNNCNGFEDLGIPSPLECWKQQAHMLASEVCDLQKDLSRTRRQVHQLIAMHDQMLRERDSLSLELIETRWELSDAKLEQSRQGASTLNVFSFAYQRYVGESAAHEPLLQLASRVGTQ